MKTIALVIASAIGAIGLFVTGAVAQHVEHHQDQTPPPAAKTETGKMSGMMCGDMMASQNETGKLVDQLVKSFAAIETENDAPALKAKLAAHGSLLNELQTKVQSQSHMMEMMQHMMGGQMMGGKMMGAAAGDDKK